MATSLIRTLGGDAGFGENFLGRNDDSSTGNIDISTVFENGLNFFGETYSSLWVNNNGSVTFDNRLGTFTPSTISEGTTPGIFPYWGDVDTRSTTSTISAGGTSQGTNLVWYDLDVGNDRMVITWDDVGYYSNGMDRVNAFQLVIEDASNDPGRTSGDFDIYFRYEWIDWTTGGASGGSGGLGGTPAHAGYSAGNAAGTFFELPQSGNQDALLALETTEGNTGEDGLWAFEVRNGGVPQTLAIRSAGDVVEGDAGTVDMVFTIDRYGDTDGTLTVDWTAFGFPPNPADSGDVTATLPLAGSVTFAAGEISQTVTLQVTGDTVVEPDEQIIVTIHDAVASTGVPVVYGSRQGFGTILDDDFVAPPDPFTGLEADIFGDPHLVTLDGLGYDFQAVGEFTLLETTSGDPLTIQIRTEPVSDVVSSTTVVAMDIGGTRVVIDAARHIPVTVDGVEVGITALTGPADIGGGAEIYFTGGMYTVVLANGEQVVVGVNDIGSMNVCAFLDPARPSGSVRGLLGNADGDTANDLALPDGTILTQPIDYGELYTTYADAWRITDATDLFDRGAGETTADWQDPSYPRGVITVDDLPADVRAAAEARALAAGITDPVLLEAAILDFALTGDSAYVNGASMVAATPTGSTDPTDAPTSPTTLLVTAPGQLEEGDSGNSSFLFTVDRLGDATAALTVTYTLSGDVNGTDIANGMSGSVEFAAGDTRQTITVQVRGDETVEIDEDLTVNIAVADETGLTFANRSATAVIEDDDSTLSFQGTEGNDTVTGDAGSNILFGLGGADSMLGSTGDDAVFGGAGDDTLDGGAGADFLDGGDGIDVVSYMSTDRRVMVDLQNDAFDLGDAVGDTYANIEVFQTGRGPDQLRGDAAGNEFHTGIFSDRLYGRAGDDFLFGEGGADALYGGLGADVMTGGDGAIRDRYIYFALSESGVGAGNRDIITDFVAGEDRIEISRFDADVTQGFKQGFDFVGNAGLSGVAGELTYVQSGGNTIVQADVNGDTIADFEIELTGLIDLTIADFYI